MTVHSARGGMNPELQDFVDRWQPRQRPTLGLFEVFTVRLLVLANANPSWRRYDLQSLALAALHLVMEHDRLTGAGWTKQQLLDGLLPLAEKTARDADPEEHKDVVLGVVDTLLNQRNGGRLYEDVYGDWRGHEYEPQRRTYNLLFYVESEEGDDLTIRASKYAVNIYRTLFSLDLYDEQAADNFLAERQLDRGDVDEVVATVKRQHLSTRVLADDVERQLNRIKRNVRAVDYRAEVMPTVDAVLAHVQEQTTMTETLKTRVDDRSEASRTTRRQIHAVAQLLDRRISDLSSITLKATAMKAIFEQEQDRQVWTRWDRDLPNPEPDLLRPLTSLSIREIERILEPLGAQLLGVRAPRLPSARAIIERSMPRQRRRSDPGTTDPFTLPPSDEIPVRVPDETLGAVRDLLSGLDAPTRLSVLLESGLNRYPHLCDEDDPNTASLPTILCIIVLTAFAPPVAAEAADSAYAEILTRHRDLLDPDRVTVHRDGARLSFHGVSGDDLLLPRTLDAAPLQAGGGPS